MNESVKNILFFTLRVLLYAVLMVVLNIVYMHDATHVTSTGKFGENSWTEILQETFLFLLGILFIIIGRRDRDLTVVSNLGSVFFFIAFIREFNNQISFWPILEIPLILILFWFLVRDRKKLIPSIDRFLKNPAIPWFVIGFLVTFIFSRLFGRTGLWENLLGDNYNRWVKNAAEEGIELLGYSLLFIAGIELFVQTFKNRQLPKE